MKKQEKVLTKINLNKELSKSIKSAYNYSDEPLLDFIKDADRYIKAVKENRLICSIPHVSSSGVSRDMKFFEMNKGKTRYNLMTFWALFKALGYSEARSNRDAFRIGGGGMDMVFHTNYTNIHSFGRLGFLSAKQVEKLAQNTPPIV